jgi:hypothetical protein
MLDCWYNGSTVNHKLLGSCGISCFAFVGISWVDWWVLWPVGLHRTGFCFTARLHSTPSRLLACVLVYRQVVMILTGSSKDRHSHLSCQTWYKQYVLYRYQDSMPVTRTFTWWLSDWSLVPEEARPPEWLWGPPNHQYNRKAVLPWSTGPMTRLQTELFVPFAKVSFSVTLIKSSLK